MPLDADRARALPHAAASGPPSTRAVVHPSPSKDSPPAAPTPAQRLPVALARRHPSALAVATVLREASGPHDDGIASTSRNATPTHDTADTDRPLARIVETSRGAYPSVDLPAPVLRRAATRSLAPARHQLAGAPATPARADPERASSRAPDDLPLVHVARAPAPPPPPIGAPGDAITSLAPPMGAAVAASAPAAQASTVRHPGPAAGQAAATAAVDVDDLVERAWNALMARMVIEQERRGYARWA